MYINNTIVDKAKKGEISPFNYLSRTLYLKQEDLFNRITMVQMIMNFGNYLRKYINVSILTLLFIKKSIYF